VLSGQLLIGTQASASRIQIDREFDPEGSGN
jgi:hypothetical protein